MKVTKAVRSVLKFAWLVVKHAALAAAALARGRPARAAEYARFLGHVVLEDAVKAVVLAQRLLPLWRRPTPGTERILIVKLDRIGDMVNTTPVFDALNEHFPKARVDLLAHPSALALLDGDGRVAERIPYRSWLYHPLALVPAGPRTWLLVLRLLLRRYQLVLFLRGSLSFLPLGLTSRFAAAKFEDGEPVLRRYLKPLEDLVGPVPDPKPRLVVTEENARFARKLLGQGGGRYGPAVAIHAGAGAPTKMWPAERYAALADGLAARFDARVHFLGGPGDKALLAAIAARAESAHAYHSALTLTQSAALVASCDLFIGNDSGPSHVAAAVGTPLVVLWGSANLSVDRPAAPPRRCVILYHDLPCRNGCPVLWCGNPNPMECLTRIDAEQVLDAVGRHPALLSALAGIGMLTDSPRAVE